MNNALIGYIAAILTTLSSIPQVYSIYQTGNVSGLSPIYFGMLLAGVILWLWYGINLRAKPVIVANAISSLTIGYILYNIVAA